VFTDKLENHSPIRNNIFNDRNIIEINDKIETILEDVDDRPNYSLTPPQSREKEKAREHGNLNTNTNSNSNILNENEPEA